MVQLACYAVGPIKGFFVIWPLIMIPTRVGQHSFVTDYTSWVVYTLIHFYTRLKICTGSVGVSIRVKELNQLN